MISIFLIAICVITALVYRDWSEQWRIAEDEQRFQKYLASKDGQVHLDVCWRVEKEPDRLARAHACVKKDYCEGCVELQRAVVLMKQMCG